MEHLTYSALSPPLFALHQAILLFSISISFVQIPNDWRCLQLSMLYTFSATARQAERAVTGRELTIHRTKQVAAAPQPSDNLDWQL